MNTGAFRRKFIYIVVMVGLLIPLFLLGQPPSLPGRSASSSGGGQGGTLAKLRDRYDIGQASLGQLDPASETMRLASLGLRGVAATILWQYADRFKEEKYWDLLAATLNQLALLQPHFVSVWESQAHNLSYNVSAEFDDYRERYAWVKKGMDYLVRGTQFNRRQPLLQWHLGKYTTMKLGRSDEKRQFRELFRNDEEYHKRLMEYGLDIEQPDSRGSDRKPDNWLVGRLWFLQAYELVRAGFYCKKNPFHFNAESPWALFYYAEAIEEEGVLDEKAMFAWNRGSDAWTEYGNMDLMTTWGHTVQLRGYASASEAAEKTAAQFNEYASELKPMLIKEGQSNLTVDELAVVQKPETELTPEEAELARNAMAKITPSPLLLCQRFPREKRAEATRLANELKEKNEFAMHIDRSREMVNFRYWETRGEMEQTATAVAARRQIFEAERYLTDANLRKAVESYNVAWKNWDKLLRRYPTMLHEESADDLLRSITRYAESADVSIGEDFPLFWFYRYRGLRDKNRENFESIKMYEDFIDASKDYDGDLDHPFEIEKGNLPTVESSPTQPKPKSSPTNEFLKTTETNPTQVVRENLPTRPPKLIPPE